MPLTGQGAITRVGFMVAREVDGGVVVSSRTPGVWFTSFTWVTLELAHAIAAARWQTRGLSAMLPTLVFTDGTGAAATPGGAGAPSSH